MKSKNTFLTNHNSFPLGRLGGAPKFLLTLLILLISNVVISQEITFDVKTFKSGTNISCHAATDGGVDATIVGGTAPYTYSWSNGATTEDLNRHTAGSYALTVT